MQSGYDQVAWALIDTGKADVNLCNQDGEVALLLGYLCLHCDSSNQEAARAVCTLAYRGGVEHVKEVLSQIDEAMSRRTYQSIDIVNYAADGRVDKIECELRQFV